MMGFFLVPAPRTGLVFGLSHASVGILTNSDALKKEEVRPSEILEYLVTTRYRISTLKKGTFFLKVEIFNHYVIKKAIRKT